MDERQPLLSQFRFDEDYRKRWTSLVIAYIGNFYMVLQDSMYWIALWPYLSAVDPTVSENFFGYVIMAFNLASAVSSPFYGFWTNKIRKTKWPIVTGLLIEILGNGMLAFGEAFPQDMKKWAILVARIVTGLGMGSEGALFSYISMASTLKERNFAISVRSAVNSAAFLFGPAVMIAFYPLGYPGIVRGYFHFNMYTAPAYMNMLLGIAQLIAVLTVYREYWVSTTTTDETNDLSGLDWRAVITSIYTRFMILFCLTFDTTIGSPLTMVMFNWSKQTAVLYNGIIQLANSVASTAGNMIVGNVILRYFEEGTLIVIGATALLLFYIITFSYPTQPLLAGGAVILQNSTDGIITNCEYKWCGYTTRINLVQYLVGYFAMTSAFLIAYVPNATLYSKVMGPVRQGTLNGFLVGAGQLAMTLSPVVCSNLFQIYGPRVTWAAGGLVAMSGIAMIVINFNHLLPYGEKKLKVERQEKDSEEHLSEPDEQEM